MQESIFFRTDRALREAGWFPGREVDIETWRSSMGVFPMHAAAEEFLREFGGTCIQVGGPGVARMRAPFDRFMELSRRFGCALFPIGAKEASEMSCPSTRVAQSTP
ncbi:SUKH-3 domain-containing protein [Streptomyces virginiae]|uniref:SUKH-3 domain-containing protein n=1 Tax=Streptomyces virginiae TaxID=1961 RepID=UPI00345736AC